MCGNEYSLNGTIARDVRTRKFRHLHLRHFVRLPHHYRSLESSRTFQDFPGPCTQISRTFQDQTHFPGLSRTWKLYPKKSRTFQERGNPDKSWEIQSKTYNKYSKRLAITMPPHSAVNYLCIGWKRIYFSIVYLVHASHFFSCFSYIFCVQFQNRKINWICITWYSTDRY